MGVKMMTNETVSPLQWLGQLDYHSLSDAQLVQLVQERDHQALAAIYDRYAKQIYALAMKMMSRGERAEEVVQEVFVKLWRKPYSYDPQRGAFINWVLGVTHNQAIDELQRERHHDRTISHLPPAGDAGEEQAIDLADPHADPAAQAWQQVQLDIVRGAMLKLPQPQCEVIEMAYFGGLTQVEIAAQLGEPLGTVKTRTRLALQKLRVLLEEQGLRS